MIARLVPIGLITFVFNLGGGLVAPALPLYARTLGADYRDLGLIGASHGLAFALLTIPLGRASDRVGRRAILLLSAIGVGAAATLYLMAGHVVGLAVGKLIEAAAWAAFWPTLEAWVAERFGTQAGTAMGVGYGTYAAAFVVGSSLGGFVVESFGLRAPFVCYLATAALSVILIAVLAGAPTTGEAAHHAVAGTPRIVTTDPARARTRRGIAYATGFIYVYGLGTVLAFLPAYGADRALSPRGVGLLLGAYWIARVIGSLGAERVAEAMSPRFVLVTAMLATAGGAALVVAPLGPLPLLVGTVALGLAAGACAPTCIGLIADHVSAEERGAAMGLFEASCGAAILASGLLGGYAAESLGGAAPYALIGLLALPWASVVARTLRAAHPV
jgi:MFS family permease